MDSSSDDSHRWSDTLSIDEKDGFVFVNYSEGQTKVPHPHLAHAGQSTVPQPLQPSTMDTRTYNQLRTGGCLVIVQKVAFDVRRVECYDVAFQLLS